MFKKILAGALSLVMLFSLASCKDTTWSAKSEKTTVSAGIYLGYLVDSTINAINSNGVYTTKELMKLTLSDKPAADFIKEEALNSVKKFIAVNEKFEELGLELSEEDVSAVDNALNTYLQNYGSLYVDNGCGETSLRAMIESNYKYDAIFVHYYGKGGEKEVPESDLYKQLTENYAKAQFITVSLLDSTTGTALEGEELEKAKAKARDYLEKAENGEDFIKLMRENSGVTEEDEEEIEEQDNGFTEYDALFKKGDTSTYPKELVNAVFELENGKYKLVTTESYAIVVKKLDINSSEKTFDYYRDSLAADLKQDEFTETVEGWVSATTVEVNNDSVKRYKPRKIKISA